MIISISQFNIIPTNTIDRALFSFDESGQELSQNFNDLDIFSSIKAYLLLNLNHNTLLADEYYSKSRKRILCHVLTSRFNCLCNTLEGYEQEEDFYEVRLVYVKHLKD